mgnify:FL=1
MNPRIQELIKQATILEDDELFVREVFDREKFAELIVRDCVNVLNKRYMGDQNREDMEVRRCVEDVKRHFGVEQ